MNNSSADIIEFTLTFNRYKTRLYNYVLKMINDRMTSEDILQNVFLKLYENTGAIRNKQSILFWLFTAARNEVYTYLRRKKLYNNSFVAAAPEELNLISDRDLPSELELNELKDIISAELDALPPDQREVFVLKEYGGLSYKEISSLMDINENLVKSRLYNTRQKLIEKISKVI